MSRGLGAVEREILDALFRSAVRDVLVRARDPSKPVPHRRWLSAPELARGVQLPDYSVEEDDEVTASTKASVRRALCTLKAKGLVVHDRRRWMLSEPEMVRRHDLDLQRYARRVIRRRHPSGMA